MSIKKFFNGFLAGSLLGAIGSMFLSPQKKQMISPRAMGKTKRIAGRAEKMVGQISNGIKDISATLKKK